jgi:2-octaprenyl-6-methoxyphenol hydroxylase
LPEDYDLLIVGGGMAGASLALLVTRQVQSQGQAAPRIAIVEAKPLEYGHHPGFDGRAIALSAGSQQIMKQAHLWDKLAPYAQAIHHIHVSDRGHVGQVSLHAQAYSLESLGQVIELEHAGAVLYQAIAHNPNISLYCPLSVERIETHQECQELVAHDGRRLRGRLLVGADGGFSAVAEYCQLNSETLDFGQNAIIANLESDGAHEQTAFERFTEQGPIALLPMTQNRWSLVWCVNRDAGSALMALRDSAFLAQLQRSFGYRAGRFVKAGRRASYPLALRQVQQVIAHRALVIGNAAQSLHPIAGQGFNLGLRDAWSLAQTISQHGIVDGDIGRYSLLVDYRNRRQQDVERTVLMTSGLVSLFGNSDKLSVVSRTIALALMQHSMRFQLPLVKQSLGQVN